MVTVVQRPLGLKFIPQAVEATVDTGTPFASVVFTAHGLSTGDYVYISSDVDAYNGIKYVHKVTNDVFQISENETSDLIPAYKEIDITYYQTQQHEWSSIFLPIVYKLTNNRWPVNSVDPTRTVSSQADDNGYTELTLSGSAGVQALEYVKIVGGSAEGVWQVVEVSGSVVTITLPYDAANIFTGATVQKYYNNYQALVKIYSGLPSGHPWEDEKPVALAAQLSLTPDGSNNLMFSVSDYIRKDVTIRNNPLLFTMPLNLDFFTGFHIETAETYDGSDGYSVTIDQSEFVEDEFQGYAIAGKLPFKNQYAGFYSDYVYASGQPAQWLNTLTRIIGLEGKYFDASFIKNILGDIELRVRKYANDYLYEEEIVNYEDQGIGVYRMPIAFNVIYDQYCIQAYKPSVPARDPDSLVLAFMENCPDGIWTEPFPPTTNAPSITLPGSGGDSGYVSRAFSSAAGTDHSFTYQITINASAGLPITTVYMALLDDDCNILDEDSHSHFSSGVISSTMVLNPVSDGTRLGIRVKNLSLPYTKTYTVTSITFNGSPASGAIAMTVELCIDVIGQCVTTEGGDVVTLSRRLLEDDGFRLLEDDGFRLLEE